MNNTGWNPKTQKPEETGLYRVFKYVPNAKKKYLPSDAFYNAEIRAWSCNCDFDIWTEIEYPDPAQVRAGNDRR